MTTARTEALPAYSATDADEIPWYDLIPEVPELPEDAMQQDDVVTLVKAILMARYADDPTALIMGPAVNLVYDSAVPGSFIVPDCFVVFGVDVQTIRHARRSYRMDEWGRTPAFVLEVGSPSTASRDLGVKREIYALMGAREYWRMDVTGGEFYGEPLVGERLVDGEYDRLELHREADGATWSRSEALGVDFYHLTDDSGYSTFELRDSETGEWLNFLDREVVARQAAEAQAQEAEAQAQEAEAQAQEAEARAQEAKERNRELKAELERLRRSEG